MLLYHCPEVELIDCVGSTAEAEVIVQKHQLDLVFLDVVLPGTTGVEWLQNMGEQQFAVVFVSAYNRYGVQAVKADAVDYLLKPIYVKELKQAVRKTIKHFWARKHSLASRGNRARKIAVSHAMGTSLINVNEITYLLADNNYTTIHWRQQKSLLVAKPLKEFELQLKGTSLFRIHKTHMINLEHVELYSISDGGRVVMEDGTMLPIARRRMAEFLSRVKHHVNPHN